MNKHLYFSLLAEKAHVTLKITCHVLSEACLALLAPNTPRVYTAPLRYAQSAKQTTCTRLRDITPINRRCCACFNMLQLAAAHLATTDMLAFLSLFVFLSTKRCQTSTAFLPLVVRWYLAPPRADAHIAAMCAAQLRYLPRPRPAQALALAP